MTFNKILSKYRKISFSERDKGNRFERLMQAYLLTDPEYAYKLKKVWLWSEFHGKADLGGSDTGIDLVALTFDGDYWAFKKAQALTSLPLIASYPLQAVSLRMRHCKHPVLATACGFLLPISGEQMQKRQSGIKTRL